MTATTGRVVGAWWLPVVAFNLVPVVGVLFLGWDLGLILVLYWIENGLTGLANIPKILAAQGSVVDELLARSATRAGATGRQATDAAAAALGRSAAGQAIVRVGVALFFCFHYGIFWLVHGVFVMLIAAGAFIVAGGSDARDAFAGIGQSALVAVAGLGVLRLLDLWTWFRERRYEHISALAQMGEPYRRVIALHVTIVAGGILVAALGQPLILLVVLVVVKTAIDLGLERRAAGRLSGGAAAAPV